MINEYLKRGITAQRKDIGSMPKQESESEAFKINDDLHINVVIQNEQIDTLAKLLELAGKSGCIDEMPKGFIESVAMLIEFHTALLDTFHGAMECDLKSTVAVSHS